MKTTVLGLFLLSIGAMAFPKVGDQATLSAKVDYQGREYAVQTVTSVTTFDSAAQFYSVHRVTTIAGSVSSETQSVPANEMYTEQSADMVLTHCASQGGRLETIQVPAGEFPTCALPQSGGTVWIGKVPFAVVKVENVVAGQGTIKSAELMSFTRGQ